MECEWGTSNVFAGLVGFSKYGLCEALLSIGEASLSLTWKDGWIQVCGHEFSFTPVYAEDAPSHLPMMVLLWGTVKKGLSAAIFLQRVQLGT